MIAVQFTAKERDAETGLDYFGARYFSQAQGRFTSPDEFPGGIVDPITRQQIGKPGPLPYADITDPQTLNKYAYVRNNPLRFVDPDGHEDVAAVACLGNGGCLQALADQRTVAVQNAVEFASSPIGTGLVEIAAAGLSGSWSNKWCDDGSYIGVEGRYRDRCRRWLVGAWVHTNSWRCYRPEPYAG